jgi:hypothetical protein
MIRRLVAVVLGVALMVGVAVPAAHAGAATDAALGLASFAVFNQVVGAFAHPRPVYAAPVYTAPVVVHRPVVYRPAPVVVAAPAPANVVYYPHGRYELRGDGVYTAYQWVWIPNATVAVAPPPPPAAPPY